MKKRISVVAAVIRRYGRVLLCQREEGDHYGLLWEFPGGAVEENETFEDALRREIKEELELIVTHSRLIGKFFDEDEYLRITVYLFDCKVKKFEPQAKECADFNFFSYSQAQVLSLAPVDRKIFNYLTGA